MPTTARRPALSTVRIAAAGVLAAAAVLVAVPTPAHAATFTVTTTNDVVDAGSCSALTAGQLPGPDGLVSLREAVCVANRTTAADTITLGAGTYQLTSRLTVYYDLTITGAGIDATTIDSDGRVVDAYPGGASLSLAFSDVTVNGGDVRSDAPDEGGVLSFWESTATLTRVRVIGGTATNGGGIASYYGTLTMLDSVVEDNAATSRGGGVLAVGTEIFMQGTTVSNNSAASGAGLALEAGSSDVSTIEQSTISANTASAYGGGILVDAFDDGQTTITDSTIADNTAGISGGGIRMSAQATSSLLVSSATITGNTAPAGAGVSQTAGSATVNRSIIAANTGGDLAGAIGGSSNIVGVAGGSIVDGVANNRAGTIATPLDPMLRALGSFGGSTQTRVPLPGSPAIDTATGCGAVDQRGQVRPAGAGCDVGAVELTAAPDTTITSAPASVVAPAGATIVAAATGGSAAYTFECDLDGSGTFTACPATRTVSGLSAGSHTLEIRAVDALGATDATPAAHTWTVTAAALAATGASNVAAPLGVALLTLIVGLVLVARRMRARQV